MPKGSAPCYHPDATYVLPRQGSWYQRTRAGGNGDIWRSLDNQIAEAALIATWWKVTAHQDLDHLVKADPGEADIGFLGNTIADIAADEMARVAYSKDPEMEVI